MNTIQRLIPRRWHDDIVVLDQGVLDRASRGYQRGTAYARIAATDWIAWRQARTSLLMHVDNDPRDWIDSCEAADGYPHVITVYNPTVSAKPVDLTPVD